MNTKALRQKILDLAIHGKLLSHEAVAELKNSPDYETADVLLEKIRKEKEEKIAKGELKRDKKDSFIFVGSNKRHYEQFADGTVKDIEDEIPFELPEGWCWCKLRTIGEYKKGPFGSSLTKAMFVPKSENTVKVYEQKNAIQKDHTLGEYYITRDYFESQMQGFEVFPGDILVSCAGTIGETYILPDNIEQGIINQALMKMKITPLINTDYFLMFFDHILKGESANNGKGTAIKNIPPFDIFKNFLFPLPPLAEQKLIVAKIEQIFEQIDSLEQNKSDLKTAVKQAKSKILDLAIHGKLVPQDPNDEPAEELLKRIATSDNRPYEKILEESNPSTCEAGGSSLQTSHLPQHAFESVQKDEAPFELPQGWAWTRLEYVCKLFNGDRGENYPSKKDYQENGIPFINAGCLNDENIDYSVANYITEKKYDSLRAGKIQKDDILYCLRGSLGKIGLVSNNVKGAISSSLCIFRTNANIIPEFFLNVLKSSVIKTQQKSVDNGTAQPNLAAKDVLNYLIPLPPLNEQTRIVNKIEELFIILDQIQNNLV